MDKVSASQIVAQLNKRHKNDLHYEQVKTGSSFETGLRIIDYLAIKKSWSPICFTAYEIKVTRNDFERDDKWMAYLKTCHMFSFCAPKGIIKLDELPEFVGLIEYNPIRQTLHTKRKAQYRDIKLPSKLLLYLLFWRTKSLNFPLKNNNAQYLEEWVNNKVSNTELGKNVNFKFLRELNRLEKLNEDNSYYKEQIDDIKQIFAESGYSNIAFWNIKSKIHELLKNKENKESINAIKEIKAICSKINL